MITLFKDLYYSFPIQLLLLSFKRYQFLLFFWLLLFAIAIGKFGAGVGAPAVFLDPEYLGNVGYLSFAIVGIGLGALFVTWNIVMYILHSHRFPFMASLQYPLGMFFLNNSIIPLIFFISYFISIILYQVNYEYQTAFDLGMDILGFVAGFTLILLITTIYFSFTNKNTGNILEENKARMKRRKAVRKVMFNEAMETLHFNRVDFYITNKFNIRHTRTVEHYDPKLHQLVFRRHHWNAFLASMVAFVILIISGFFIENPFFQIPIAASGSLFLCVLMSMFGLFLYWTGGWGTAAIIAFVILANQLTKYDFLGSQNRAYGLNYNTTKANYSLETFRSLSSDSNIVNDKQYFFEILENWKRKNVDPRKPFTKPKMVFINVSGGGVRAGIFTMAVLQDCDSMLQGKLLDKTFLASGASGGMFGITYLRELFYQKKEGFPINLQDRQYAYNVSKDLLNPIALSILSNDALLPFHKFRLDSNQYFKDRGYIFERSYCNNTGLRFDKKIGDYKEAEYNAKIPLVIYHTTIMNDSRRYFISAQPVSFLMRPHGKNALDNKLEIDGIDFCKFFEKQGGSNLLVTSAMRMDATFPFILPNPVLPSEPSTAVMDGGALDNTGVETTFRFLQTFKDWINANTSGVIIIQIRDAEKQEEPEAQTQKTLFARLTDPLGTVYSNMDNMQDFFTDQKLNYLDEELRGKLKFILFEYTTEKKDDKAAMSMHISSRDKNDILKSLHRTNNVIAFEKLKRLLAEQP
ncbi:MAG: hypothetical protein U0T74_04110 [Chitinophagales bacterium]